jgi:FKBP-type peptidyl-prolyl cis-trans isomerase 2
MTERSVESGDTLSLRYAIRLRDGTEIISNFDEAEPDDLTLGDGTLAPPWSNGWSGCAQASATCSCSIPGRPSDRASRN